MTAHFPVKRLAVEASIALGVVSFTNLVSPYFVNLRYNPNYDPTTHTINNSFGEPNRYFEDTYMNRILTALGMKIDNQQYQQLVAGIKNKPTADRINLFKSQANSLFIAHGNHIVSVDIAGRLLAYGLTNNGTDPDGRFAPLDDAVVHIVQQFQAASIDTNNFTPQTEELAQQIITTNLQSLIEPYHLHFDQPNPTSTEILGAVLYQLAS